MESGPVWSACDYAFAVCCSVAPDRTIIEPEVASRVAVEAIFSSDDFYLILVDSLIVRTYFAPSVAGIDTVIFTVIFTAADEQTVADVVDAVAGVAAAGGADIHAR